MANEQNLLPPFEKNNKRGGRKKGSKSKFDKLLEERMQGDIPKRMALLDILYDNKVRVSYRCEAGCRIMDILLGKNGNP